MGRNAGLIACWPEPYARVAGVEEEYHAVAVSRQAESEILIADDQSDVLEALHILLKPEGYRIHTASSPGAVIDAVDAHEFDLVLMDLNYTRDTTSGDEGLDILTEIHGTDSTLPIIRHDRLGHHRSGGRGDEKGRPRFRPEAMGKPTVVDDRSGLRSNFAGP